ncbi:MAG: TIGR03435 family protein [Candidatus Solibacter sp.]
MREILTMLLLAAGSAMAADPARFEVASVKVTEPARGESIQVGTDSVSMRRLRLNMCIAWAYDLREDQVSGPGWMNDVGVDIQAKAAAPAKVDELRGMMQSLLAERFKLASHRQIKELPSLVLTVSKGGHKMQPVEQEGSPSFQTGKMNLTGKGATLAQLINFLSHELRFPVIDQTGLTGRFNYFLDIASYITEEMRKDMGASSGPPPDAPTIVAQALQSQLGLKMDSKKMPIDTLVVDHLEKAPTEN